LKRGVLNWLWMFLLPLSYYF